MRSGAPTEGGRPSSFLPVDYERVAEDLLALFPEGSDERARFAALARRFRRLYELELDADLRRLRELHRPFDAEAESVPSRALESPGPRGEEELVAALRGLLTRANFTELSHEDVERALQKTSPRGVEVHVDFDAYERLHFFGRGATVRVERTRDWMRGRFRAREVRTPIYRRLCLVVKLAAREDGDEGRSRLGRLLRRPPARSPEGDLRPGAVYLKLFRDIAATDLEMLVPNTRVRMKLRDKWMLGLTGGGGTVGGVAATLSKLGAAASPTTWAFALGGLGAVLWRQLARVFAHRTRYMAALTANLYCRSLDNGFGVLTRLAEAAGDEECKEALLALHFLERRGERGATPDELDREVEAHVRATYALDTDFDVADGLAKLRRADLVVDAGGGRLAARPVEHALERLADRIRDAAEREL